MNSHKEPFIDELNELFLLSLEDKIDAHQFERLQGYLSSHAVIREYYYDFVATYVGLNDPKVLSESSVSVSPFLDHELWEKLAEAEKAAPPIDLPREKFVPAMLIQRVEHPKVKRDINKVSFVAGLVSLAAVLLFIITIQLLPSKAAKPVASLMRGFNTRWGNSQEAMVNGVRLWNDGQWYDLKQGLVEVAFDSGAKVFIEAPSQFQLLNENEMVFQGSLTANVPPSAYGFTVNTLNSKVVDLGTEFGLRATGGDESELHVTKGQVELLDAVASPNDRAKQLVKAGQGYHVDESGTIARVTFRKEGFCWDEPTPYEQAVYETKPLCYWRFDRDRETLLRNEMNPEPRPQNQLIGSIGYGAGPVLGEDRSNRALRLDGSNDGYAVLLDSATGFRRSPAIAISVWVYPESGISTDQSILLTTSEKGPDTNFNDQIYLTYDAKFGFYVYCPKALRRMMITSSVIELNRWHHVVACRTPDQMKLYVDGQLQAADNLPAPGGETSSHLYGCIGRGTGHYEGASVKFQKWPFKGLVDELSQYDRELSAEEVDLLYQAAVKPR